jgi:serine/threonine protein kinase
LRDLHDIEYPKGRKTHKVPEFGFGPMIPEHLFYDARLDRLRFSAVSISNFAWDVLGWKRFAALIDSTSRRYVAPEQFSVAGAVAKIDKRKTDQYMLGQLMVEMLDRRLPLAAGSSKDDIDDKDAIFDDPLRYAGAWTVSHPQLQQIVSKMLARNPDQRWGDMDEIVTALKGVEPNQRAIAKASYRTWIEPDTRFFEDFYRRFFATPVAKRAHSSRKFTDRKHQHDKLRKGMAAVLNFYPGNEPTSLRYVIDVHRDRQVTNEELEQFSATFLKLLSERLDRKIKGKGSAARKKEIVDAWAALFDQVLKHFHEEGLTKDGAA